MKSAQFFPTALLFATLYTGSVCAQDNFINITPENLKSFNAIEADGNFTLLLEPGSQPAVFVLQPSGEYKNEVKLEVESNTLNIDCPGAKDGSDMTVKVVYQTLNNLKIKSTVEAYNEQPIESPEFTLVSGGATQAKLSVNVAKLNSKLSGASDVKLIGTAQNHDLKVSGAASLNAVGLSTQYTNAEISGAGNAKVWTTDSLQGIISGAGNIYYKGDPIKVNIEVSGAGKALKMSPSGSDTTRINAGGKREVVIVKKDRSDAPKKTKKARFDGHWAGLELGLNLLMNSDYQLEFPVSPVNYSFLEPRINKSFGVGVNFAETNLNLIKNKLGLTTGLGLEFNNYRLQNNIRLRPDTSIIWYTTDPARNYTKSKLQVSYLKAPLLLEFQTNNKSKLNSFHLAAGGIIGLRIGSHTKMVYEENGIKQKSKVRDDFHLNPLKYELTARIGWGNVNLFANYALSTLFDRNKGPEMYPFTAGVCIVNF